MINHSICRRVHASRLSLAGATTIGAVAFLLATTAQAAPASLVSACSGVSLPPSVVTGILTPVVNGIVAPTQTTVNGLLGAVSGIPVGLGLLPAPLSIDAAGLLAGAAAGAPISLSVLTTSGAVLAPGSQCNTTTDTLQLNTPAGIALGGNQLTGLGNGAPASAGEVNSIALGNGASTTPGATTSVALGNGASVTAANSVALGAGSTATRGAANGSAGEVSVGAPGATRQITNVAAGTAPTDAATVGQVTASAAAAPIQYSTIAAPTTANPGVPSNDTTLVGATAGTPVGLHNVAAGTLGAGSTDAVNGGQLFTTNANVATNATNIANLTNGTAGLVQQATPTATVTVAAATGGTTVDITGTAGTRTLTGVTAGAAPTDAVNFGQLTATNANVATNTANIATNTTNITALTNGVNNGTIGLVQQAGGLPTGAITVGAATGGTSLNVAGTAGNRIISGVAAGVAPTDAANVGQVTGAIGTATANAVQYDTVGGVRANSVTLAGGAAGPVTVTNVAPGALTGTSTDAVNGSQLAATNANVTTNTTNIASLTAGTAGPVQQTGAANGLALVAPGGTGTAPGAPQTLSNVAAGVAPTDAVNLAQTTGLIASAAGTAPIQYSTAAAPTTATPGVASNDTTLVGAVAGTPVGLHNVAAGTLTATSTDAVNGGQLFATNANVATNAANIAGNTTAITNLTNGTTGLVQQTPTATGPITVGAATGGTSVSIAGTGGNRTLTGLSAGLAGNDAVTVAQVNGLTGGGLNTVQYDPTTIGGRSNTVTLAGGAPGGVTVTNLNPGLLTAASTDAVNGGQLYATNQQLASLTLGQAGAFQSNNAAAAPAPVATGANAAAGGFGASATGAGGVALGNGATSTGVGSVAIGQNSTDGGVAGVVSVGGVGSERRITNVAPALNGTDAVNLSQLQAATTAFNTTATGLQNQVNGLQSEINGVNFDLNQVRRRANGATAGAMAIAGLPQAFEPGKSMVGGGFGYWQDQVAFAIGVSSIVGDHTVVKAGGSINGQGVGGFNAGVGFQF